MTLGIASFSDRHCCTEQGQDRVWRKSTPRLRPTALLLLLLLLLANTNSKAREAMHKDFNFLFFLQKSIEFILYQLADGVAYLASVCVSHAVVEKVLSSESSRMGFFCPFMEQPWEAQHPDLAHTPCTALLP